MATIDTNPPSGTRDFLASDVIRRRRVIDAIREVFDAHGFEPLETPAFERLDVLLGKYGEEGDTLMFKILRRGEHEASGEADLALRYDLTVPLARVVAAYADRIGMPYRRYQIAPVWRADRPGRGRFREILQCDADVVGSDSPLADAEVMLAVVDALAAIGLTDFEVQLNSRRALEGLMAAYEVPAELAGGALVALDKLDKVGADGVARELRERGLAPETVERVAADLAADDLADRAGGLLERTEVGRRGAKEVEDVRALVEPNMSAGKLRVAPVLARGLDYYTGPIFEVVTADVPGSIASGGRYDGLVGMFLNRDVPACGGSVGVERVLMLHEGALVGEGAPQVLVALVDGDGDADALALATELRRAGVKTELYVGSGRVGKQVGYASDRGVPVVVLQGPQERAGGSVAVKDLASGEQVTVPRGELVPSVQQLVDPAARVARTEAGR